MFQIALRHRFVVFDHLMHAGAIDARTFRLLLLAGRQAFAQVPIHALSAALSFAAASAEYDRDRMAASAKRTDFIAIP